LFVLFIVVPSQALAAGLQSLLVFLTILSDVLSLALAKGISFNLRQIESFHDRPADHNPLTGSGDDQDSVRCVLASAAGSKCEAKRYSQSI